MSSQKPNLKNRQTVLELDKSAAQFDLSANVLDGDQPMKCFRVVKE